MDGKCTVYFEDPYWVAVFEHSDESGYAAARFVFGSEPTEAELHKFAIQDFHRLSFSQARQVPATTEREMGFKHRQRKVRQHMQQEGIGTYAQRVLQAEHEQMKQVHQKESREERDSHEQEKFLLKQAKKKEKHRGR